MRSPVLVQAPNEAREELVPSSEVWPTLGAKGDLELLAEEQVLDDEAPTAAEGGDVGGLYEPDEFEHRGRIADQLSADRRAAFALLQAAAYRRYGDFLRSGLTPDGQDKG